MTYKILTFDNNYKCLRAVVVSCVRSVCPTMKMISVVKCFSTQKFLFMSNDDSIETCVSDRKVLNVVDASE